VPRIIYELMRGKRRFNELSGAVGGCNSARPRRLKLLEELQVIERRHHRHAPWVEYELTDKGCQLGEAMARLEEWARRHMTQPAL
jgi:DNA-binding HxlR family transcriptional regulator